MSEIVNGFIARKIGNERMELQNFYLWCQKRNYSKDDTWAAVRWEILLSRLKKRNSLKVLEK